MNLATASTGLGDIAGARSGQLEDGGEDALHVLDLADLVGRHLEGRRCRPALVLLGGEAEVLDPPADGVERLDHPLDAHARRLERRRSLGRWAGLRRVRAGLHGEAAARVHLEVRARLGAGLGHLPVLGRRLLVPLLHGLVARRREGFRSIVVLLRGQHVHLRGSGGPTFGQVQRGHVGSGAEFLRLAAVLPLGECADQI
jgi:hypothetical protein